MNDLHVACCESNDLCGVLQDNGIACIRHAVAADAVGQAPDGAGVMILADGYPEATTPVDPALYELAAEKRLRLYV